MAKDTNCNCDCGKRIWIPNGSTSIIGIINNKDLCLSIFPPTGFAYVGYDKQNNLQLLKEGGTTVSCKCNNTSGACSPFIGHGPDGDAVGCAGDCTDCTMKQSFISAPNVEIITGGFINLAEKVSFVEIGQNLPSAFKAMFELPEVKTALKVFLDRVYGGLPIPVLIKGNNFITAPDGYSLAAVNICGRAVIVPVPSLSLKLSNAASSSATCSCTKGTCTLKDDTLFGYGAIWCEATDCTGTCTLKTGIFISNGGFDSVLESSNFVF